MKFKRLYRLLFVSMMVLALRGHGQETIGYVQMQGNDGVVNLSVISVADAITAGNGVVKVAMPGGDIGAAHLVPVSDFDASEVRINTGYGIMSWKKARVYGEAIGSVWSDIAYMMDFTANGDILIAGETWGFGTGTEHNGLLLETTTTGDINWAEVLGSAWGDVIRSARETTDGGYVILGRSGMFGFGGWDIWLRKMDASFGTTWGLGFGGADDDRAFDIFEDDDGGFVFIGRTESFPGPDANVYVRKVSSTGANVWGWSYGRPGVSDWGFSVIKDVVPGYIAFGTTTNVDSGDYDIHLRKIAADGTLGTSWWIGGPGGDDVGRKVVISHDNKYVISGYTDRFGQGMEDFYLSKRDTSLGVSYWSKAYGGDDEDKLWSMIRTNDNGFAMVGETDSFNAAGSADILLVKVDADGEVEWSWLCGGYGTDIGYDVIQDEFGFYYVAGQTQGIGAGSADFVVMKFTPDGTTCATSFSAAASDQQHSDFIYRRIEGIRGVPVPTKVGAGTLPGNVLNDRGAREKENPVRVPVVPTLTVICN